MRQKHAPSTAAALAAAAPTASGLASARRSAAVPAPVTDMHLVDARFDRRIVFGSDHVVWSEALERAVESIRQAPLPNAAQKRGILHDNAARFLRREPAGTDGPSRP